MKRTFALRDHLRLESRGAHRRGKNPASGVFSTTVYDVLRTAPAGSRIAARRGGPMTDGLLDIRRLVIAADQGASPTRNSIDFAAAVPVNAGNRPEQVMAKHRTVAGGSAGNWSKSDVVK